MRADYVLCAANKLIAERQIKPMRRQTIERRHHHLTVATRRECQLFVAKFFGYKHCGKLTLFLIVRDDQLE